MTVYVPKGRKRFVYDFEWRGQRYFGSTGMSRLRDAEEFERKERVRLERQAGDLSLRADETPRIQDWVEVFYEHKRTRGRRLKRPELLEREIHVVLEFAGARPTAAAPVRRPGAPPRRVVPVAPPYHDLRLGDFIERPEWITEFEHWLRARGTGGSARNHYRSVMSGIYKVAMLPEYRRKTGVRLNPFAGIERERTTRRRVTLTVEQLRAWVQHAAPHVRLALAIGGLAPVLRLGSVLRLRWDVDVFDDDAVRFIVIRDHKGDSRNPEPLQVPITAQLRAILKAARAAWEARRAKKPRTTSDAVIQFRGRPLQSIKKGLREAARRADVPYGVKAGGATFHTLRHTMATMLAEIGVPEAHRKELLGHSDIATTQIYTHLRPVHLADPLEQLSGAVPLEDVMMGEPPGPGRTTPTNPPGTQTMTRKRTSGRKAKNRPERKGGIEDRRRAS